MADRWLIIVPRWPTVKKNVHFVVPLASESYARKDRIEIVQPTACQNLSKIVVPLYPTTPQRFLQCANDAPKIRAACGKPVIQFYNYAKNRSFLILPVYVVINVIFLYCYWVLCMRSTISEKVEKSYIQFLLNYVTKLFTWELFFKIPQKLTSIRKSIDSKKYN